MGKGSVIYARAYSLMSNKILLKSATQRTQKVLQKIQKLCPLKSVESVQRRKVELKKVEFLKHSFTGLKISTSKLHHMRQLGTIFHTATI